MGKFIKWSSYITFILQIITELIFTILHFVVLLNCFELKEHPIRLKEIKFYLTIKSYINISQDIIGLIIVSISMYSFYFKISRNLLIFIV